jgi:hypothetical protein
MKPWSNAKSFSDVVWQKSPANIPPHAWSQIPAEIQKPPRQMGQQVGLSQRHWGYPPSYKGGREENMDNSFKQSSVGLLSNP